MNPKHIKILQAAYEVQQRGDLKAAAKGYHQVLASDPRNEFALNLLGVVYLREQRFADALKTLQEAVSVNPTDAETQNNMGLAWRGLHEYPNAASAFRQSLKINPRQPAVLNNLGNAMAAQDKHAQGIEAFAAALTLDPSYAECLHNLSVSLLALGRTKDALLAISDALKSNSNNSVFLNTKAEILLRDAQYEDAKACCEAAIAVDGSMQARVNLSTALKQLGDVAAAEEALSEVISRQPDHAEAHHHLGVLREQLGHSADAAKAYRAAIAHNPRLTSAYYQLSKLRIERLTESEVERIHELLDDPSLLEVFRPPLYFALACEAEKDRDYQSSLALFKQAQEIKAARNPYQKTTVEAYVRSCKNVFPVAPQATVAAISDDPIPVFIIGMPRSGTTLTEQILSSHTEISSAGEVGFINDLANHAFEKTGKPFPSCVAAITRDLAVELRSMYFSKMRSRGAESKYIVDKNPLNFNFVGFIAAVFPEARFVYCKRDPLDNCVSIFRLPFDENQGYSHTLSGLGHFYLAHSELMRYWKSLYPQMIISLAYEDTVNQLERESRRVLEFLGADFEPEVLRYFENRRAVLTPSTEQVRQPIYTSSVNIWQRYGPAINPLLTSLGIEPKL